MKVPKYIEKALQARAKAAEMFIANDSIISNFIEKHNIPIDETHYHTGSESLICPWSSIEIIKKSIEDFHL